MPDYRDENDKAFAEAALEFAYVTDAQLERCLETQAQMGGMGISKDLVEIMLDRKLITFAQGEAVRRAAGNRERLKILGSYEILEELGAGGMGSVYKARHLDLGRTVALKVLKDELAGDPDFISRFRREARAVASLNHVNIVHCYEVGREKDVYFMAMEFVDGENVGGILDASGPMGEPEALGICIQVCRALQHAWDNGIVHRDIKPDNVLYIRPAADKGDAVCGLAKVSDLGLARLGEQHGPKLTQTGMALGTPHYISPEQASGSRDVDIRADIYSLGASLYHMATGRTPYDGPTMTAIMLCHLTKPVPDPREAMPTVSAATSAIVMKAMAKDPEDRYQTPADMERALQSALETIGFQPPRSATDSVSRINIERYSSTIVAGAVPVSHSESTVAPAEPAPALAPVVTSASGQAASVGPAAGPGDASPVSEAGSSRRKAYAIAGVVIAAAAVAVFFAVRSAGRKDDHVSTTADQPAQTSQVAESPRPAVPPVVPPKPASETKSPEKPSSEAVPAEKVAQPAPSPASAHAAATEKPPSPKPEPPAKPASEQPPKATVKPADKTAEKPAPKPATASKSPSSAPPPPKTETKPPEPAKSDQTVAIPKQFEPALQAFLKDDLEGARKDLSRLAIKDSYSTHAEVIKCFIALKESHKTGSNSAKTEAQTAFGQLELHGGAGATPMLVRILKDGDYRIRVDACRLLGKTGDSRALEFLQAVMSSDANEAARLAARDAIATLTGKPAGLLDNIPLPVLR
ncbi:MAG TPA: protein kinase [Candidatus Brocadiia bacterium]|nr:protein kinase [Candidatus Brocadiia bacterium]